MDHGILGLFFIAAVTLSLLAGPFMRKLKLPYPIIVVIIGFVFSEIIVGLGFDTGIRASNFAVLSSWVFIPILIFQAAFKLKLKNFLEQLKPILLLAFPVLIITFIILTLFLYFLIGHPTGFPWLAALLCASLLVATNMRAINDCLRQLGIKPELITTLEGESVLNGTVGVVLFSFILSIALSMGESNPVWFWLGKLMWMFIGGILTGGIIGWLFSYIYKKTNLISAQALLTVLCAYSAYIIGNSILASSGVIAVFCAGLMLNYKTQKNTSLNQFWEFNILWATTGVFLLVGAVITLGMFEERWLAMLIAIVSVIIGRWIGVFSCFNIIKHKKINIREQSFISYCGIKGALAIALAFSIPTQLDYWWTIQSIVFGVVLFSMMIQGGLLPWVKTKLLAE